MGEKTETGDWTHVLCCRTGTSNVFSLLSLSLSLSCTVGRALSLSLLSSKT